SRILVLGVAYKKDIDDLRESPALEVIQHLQEKGAEVRFHDPYVPVINDDGHTPLQGLPLNGVPFNAAELAAADAVVVVTDHKAIDYQLVADQAKVVVDSRG